MNKFFAGVLIAALGLLLAACSSLTKTGGQSKSKLVISAFPENNELARVCLGPDKQFSLSFIHSVSNTRVTDVYEIQDGSIVQIREIFMAHGAGLPSSVDEPGGIVWENKDGQFILHMERLIPKLVVRTDKKYENRLLADGLSTDLNQWKDQALLLFYKIDKRDETFD